MALKLKYLDSSFAFQVGIFAVGGIIGSFLTKVLTTKFGRKGSQAINMFISIAGAANFIGAYQYSSPGTDYVIMTSSLRHHDIVLVCWKDILKFLEKTLKCPWW